MIQRKCIIIYYKKISVIEKLDKNICNVYYVSKNNNYAVVYCDLNRYKGLCNELTKNPNVISIEDSLLDVEKNEF